MPSHLSRARAAAFYKQAGYCVYCHFPMWLSDPQTFASKHGISVTEAMRFQCTAEHLIAAKDGGSYRRDNIAAACHFCNQARHRRRCAPTPKAHESRVLRRIASMRWHPRHLIHCLSAYRPPSFGKPSAGT